MTPSAERESNPPSSAHPLALRDFDIVSTSRWHRYEKRHWADGVGRAEIERGSAPRSVIGSLHGRLMVENLWADREAMLSVGERLSTLAMLAIEGEPPRLSDAEGSAAVDAIYPSHQHNRERSPAEVSTTVLKTMELLMQVTSCGERPAETFRRLGKALQHRGDVAHLLCELLADRAELERFLEQHGVIQPTQSEWMRAAIVRVVNLRVAVELQALGGFLTPTDMAGVLAWEIATESPSIQFPDLLPPMFSRSLGQLNPREAYSLLSLQLGRAQAQIDSPSRMLTCLALGKCREVMNGWLPTLIAHEMNQIVRMNSGEIPIDEGRLATFFRATAALNLRPQTVKVEMARAVLELLPRCSHELKVVGMVWLSTVWSRISEQDKERVASVFFTAEGRADFRLLADFAHAYAPLAKTRTVCPAFLDGLCCHVARLCRPEESDLAPFSSHDLMEIAGLYRGFQYVPVPLFSTMLKVISHRIFSEEMASLPRSLQTKELKEGACFLKILAVKNYLDVFDHRVGSRTERSQERKMIWDLAVEISRRKGDIPPWFFAELGTALTMLDERVGKMWFGANREYLMSQPQRDSKYQELLFRLCRFHGAEPPLNAEEIVTRHSQHSSRHQLQVREGLTTLRNILRERRLLSFSVSEEEMIGTFPCDFVVRIEVPRCEAPRVVMVEYDGPQHFIEVGSKKLLSNSARYRDVILRSEFEAREPTSQLSISRIGYREWEHWKNHGLFAFLARTLGLNDDQRAIASKLDENQSNVDAIKRILEPEPEHFHGEGGFSPTVSP